MPKALFQTCCLLLLLGIGISPLVSASADELSKRLLHAHEQHLPIPNLSHEIGPDIARAYQVQTAYVKGRLVNDKIAGFKAGLTTEDTQSQFGASRPVSGVLFSSGDYSKKRTLSLQQFHHLMIETEIGYITKKPIHKTVQSVEELKTYIGEVIPVIELSDIGFVAPKTTVQDLIAANAVSTGYIMFRQVNWKDKDVNTLAVALYHDDTLVNQGLGEDALGDQWEALRWLVNHVIAQGWTIEKGHLLMTGALGNILPARPGVYRVQYDNGAKFSFRVNA